MSNMPNKKQKPDFCTMWEQQRKAGLLFYILMIGSCTMIALLFAQLIYLTAIRDYSEFKIRLPFVLVSVLVGAAYWFINEARYKKLNDKNDRKK